MDNFLKKTKAVVIGHAVADALGVPVEFRSREELDQNPVTDMLEYGTHHMPKGAWSDDTSMSLCALDSLANGVDLTDVMDKFCLWYYEEKYTPTGVMFDIGYTCKSAIVDYYIYKQPIEACAPDDEQSNGNGSLMRIHPFSLYLYKTDMPIEEKIEIIHKASALTHAHERSKLACGIYTFVLWSLLDSPSPRSVSAGLNRAKKFYKDSIELSHYQRVLGFADLQFAQATPREEIVSGGYVVTSLEAALWCLLTTKTYEECVIKAVNLGRDTDTVAAIAGGLAGAMYGYDTIPQRWRNDLINSAWIEELCSNAFSKKQ